MVIRHAVISKPHSLAERCDGCGATCTCASIADDLDDRFGKGAFRYPGTRSADRAQRRNPVAGGEETTSERTIPCTT
jgi:hypothetical protein